MNIMKSYYRVPEGEILEALLPYIYEEVENPKEIWNKILELCEAPIDCESSLHVVEEVYEIDGVEYSCTWSLEADIDAVPHIEIRRERKKSWTQLELF